MRLVKNWRRVLLRAQSMWGVYAATALEIASNALPYVGEKIPWWASVAILIATPLLRIRDQGGIDADD